MIWRVAGIQCANVLTVALSMSNVKSDCGLSDFSGATADAFVKPVSTMYSIAFEVVR